MVNLQNRTGIIFALDDFSKGQPTALGLAELLNDHVDAIKVSWPAIIAFGGEFMDRLSGRVGVPIIADFKVADIPDMTKRIVREAATHHANGIIIHGFMEGSIGPGLQEAHEKGMLSFVVAATTSPSLYIREVTMRIAKLASGGEYEGRGFMATGLVLPATQPQLIKDCIVVAGHNMTIISPGAGIQGGNIGDAIAAGAHYEIIGHAIYDTPDPEEAAQHAAKIIQRVRNKSQENTDIE